MLSRLLCTILCIACFVSVVQAETIRKEQARVERLQQQESKSIHIGTGMATSDTCVVRHDAGEYWIINGWVVGNELYKNYLDPSLTCDAPYPFQVTEINMMMWFDAGVTFTASVDIELADMSDPSCPAPGNLIAISSPYSITVPAAGLYNIWLPLDTFVTVTSPFFAGFYIGDVFDPAVGAAVITDTIPVECQAWNIWDTAIGFVPLDTAVGFPGQLILYAAGIPGGSGGGEQPEPVISFRYPLNADTLFGSANLWAAETSGSDIIDYVSFQYWNGSAYTEIGRDYSGTAPFRNGVGSTGVGDGWSLDWNFNARPEGMQKLKVVAVDTLGRSSVDSVTVFLEPTPPVPTITIPLSGGKICAPVNVAFSTMDENLQSIAMFSKNAVGSYSAGIIPLSQFAVGDNNGNLNDNNLAVNGEFGDYYNAPVAAAMALRLWSDRGYTNLMKDNGASINAKSLAEKLATRFLTRTYKGTYDEDVVKGIQEYGLATGVNLKVTYTRIPDYFDIRTAVEEQQQAVMLAIGGNPGTWITMEGFVNWQQPDSSFYLKAAIPNYGSIQDVQFRMNGASGQIWFEGGWKNLDAMLTISPTDWSVTRTAIGSDMNGANGWSFSWSPGGISNGTWLYLRSLGTDATNQQGSSTVLVQYDCSQSFAAGDYTGDASSNLLDLNYLIAFVRGTGPAPVGGAGRADANCDNRVNIADVVYYMNFLFGGAGAPCR